MIPAGIEPATFRFVAQHLSHCATTVYNIMKYNNKMKRITSNKTAAGRKLSEVSEVT